MSIPWAPAHDEPRRHRSRATPGSVTPPLPSNLLGAVRQEFSRAFHPPFEQVAVVVFNGALMSSLWFFLPPSLKNDVFTLHGSLLFAVVLSAWMYADVPATNVMGSDARRMLLAIDDPVMLGRLLDAKSIVLWSLVTPVSLVAAAIAGLRSHVYLATLYSAVWIVVVPFGVLGIAAWVGILWPYHTMPVRFRLTHAHPRFRMLWRWLFLITIPYAVVPMLGALLISPSLLIWGFSTSTGLTRQLPRDSLGIGIAVACVIAAICSIGGRRVSRRLIARRRDRLVDFLSDPTRG